MFLFLCGIAIWLLEYPRGFFDIDISYCFSEVLRGHWSPWFSYTYTALVDLIWNLTQSIFPLMYLQVGLFSLASLWLLWKLRDLPKIYSWIFLLFIFLGPMHANQLLAFLRDSTFSALLPIFLILLFDLNYVSGSWPVWWRILAIALIGGAASSLRFDALLIIPCVFIFTFWKLEIPKNRKFILAFLLTFSALFFNIGLKNSPKALKGSRDYQLTAFVHPLSVAAHHGTLTPEQESAIENIISVDSLRKLYDPIQIRPYHEGRPKGFNNEQWLKLTSQLPSIFWDNWMAILISRFDITLTNLGFARHTYTRLSGSVGSNASAVANIKTLGLDGPKSEGWLSKYFRKIEYWAYDESLIRTVFYCALPFFFLCFLILRNFRQNPLSTTLLVLCWIRLPVIFLLAPGAHMKYVYPFYIGTLFCFFLAKIEVKSRTRKMVA